jgi:hypothetical protein
VGSSSASPGEPGDPRRTSLGRDYWLRRCEGFLAETPTRRLGLVAGVGYGAKTNQPELLALRAGFLGHRLLLVTVQEEVRVVPSSAGFL